MGGLFFRGLALSSRWEMKKLVLVAIILGSLYGVSDEYHQSFIPGRFAMLDDVVADVVGSVLGALLGSWLYIQGQDRRWRFRFMR